MYAFISGRVVSSSEGQIIVENNGIGYQLNVSNTTLAEGGQPGVNRQFYTYLYVKEDVFSLYGFTTEEEKNMFLKLISISGVGPKMALQVLSGMDSKSLAIAIVTGDTKGLSKIKGLGKKTAERIILELKEGLSDEQLVSSLDKVSPVASADKLVQEAALALQSLGIGKAEAFELAVNARSFADTLEDIISLALRQLAR
ncbi:MAG TPA: Holliday junction branch migration protein RuvA [Candidatus Faecicola pullistercoris]|nr:Holliday junction branch migration protein RuvA [Candidatus Faecicola pullistercoris]